MANLIFHGIAYPYGVYYNTQQLGTPNRLNLLQDKIYGPVGMVPDYDWPNPNLPTRPSFVAVTAQPLGTPPRLNLLKDKMYGAVGQVSDYDWPNPGLRTSSLVAIVAQPFGSQDVLLVSATLPVGAKSNYQFVVQPFYRVSSVVAITSQPLGTPPRLNLLVDKMYGGPGEVADYDWPNPVLRVSSFVALTTGPPGSFTPLITFVAPNLNLGANNSTYGQWFISDRTYLVSQPLGVAASLTISPAALPPGGSRTQPNPLLPQSVQTAMAAQPLGRFTQLVGTPPAIAFWTGVPLEYRTVDTQPLGIPPSFTPPQPPPIVNLPFVTKAIEPPYVALFSQPLGTWFNIEGCKVPYTPVPCPPGTYSAIANPSGSYSQVDCPPPNYTPVKTTC